MAYSFLGLVAQGVRCVIPVVMLIKVMMFNEILRINQKERKDRQMPYFKLLPWYFLTVTVFAMLAYNLKEVLLNTVPAWAIFYRNVGITTFALYVVGFVAFVLSLRKGYYKYQIGQFTWISMTLIFIMVQGSLQITNMLNGMFFFLLPVSCVVHNDVWAYACGTLFGRTKLLALSPKKTLEGFLGAWVMTTIWAVWFAGYMPRFKRLVCPELDLLGSVGNANCEIDAIFLPAHAIAFPSFVASVTGWSGLTLTPMQLHAIVFAAFSSLIAPFGGFFASGLKRAFKLKDFGTLIPGHGGMTDRMDCQIIMGLFTFVYLQTVIFRGEQCPSVDHIVTCLMSLPPAQLQHVLNQVKGSPP